MVERTKQELKEIIKKQQFQTIIDLLIHSFSSEEEIIDYFLSLPKERIERAFKYIHGHGWDFQLKV